MALPKKKLFLAFAFVSIAVTGSGLVIPSADQKPNPFDCPEATGLERQDTLNKLLGKKDAALEDTLAQQYNACDNRALRQLNVGPGKSYNPWEDVQSPAKNWDSPGNFGI